MTSDTFENFLKLVHEIFPLPEEAQGTHCITLNKEGGIDLSVLRKTSDQEIKWYPVTFTDNEEMSGPALQAIKLEIEKKVPLTMKYSKNETGWEFSLGRLEAMLITAFLVISFIASTVVPLVSSYLSSIK